MTFRATAVFTTPTTPSSAPWRDVSGFSRACSYPQNIRDTCILWPPSGIARVVLHLLLLLPPHEAQEIGSNVSDLAFLVWTYSFPHFCSKVTLPVKGLRRNSNAYRKFRRMRSNYLHACGSLFFLKPPKKSYIVFKIILTVEKLRLNVKRRGKRKRFYADDSHSARRRNNNDESDSSEIEKASLNSSWVWYFDVTSRRAPKRRTSSPINLASDKYLSSNDSKWTFIRVRSIREDLWTTRI
ncbi:hypothetical protein V1477_001171, partial [Vespula maculifrons]